MHVAHGVQFGMFLRNPPQTARNTKKAPPMQGFLDAPEEDSNLDPVIPDQALKLLTRLSDPS